MDYGGTMADVHRLRQQLNDFFSDLKQYGPKRGADLHLLPPVALDKEVEGSEFRPDAPPDPTYRSETPEEIPDAAPFARTRPDGRRPIAAVDAGVMRLGESADGIVIALRAAILVTDRSRRVTGLVRSGPIFLGWEHETELLLLLGQWLGDPTYYVSAERGEDGGYRGGSLKDGVGGRKYLPDRFRAGIERFCQRLAAASVSEGTLLMDGALTLRSRDTPDAFMNQIAHVAGSSGNNIVGISKKSELVVGGRAVSYWLDDQPNMACHRPLTPILRAEDARTASGHGSRADRVMGNVYAARLSPLGPTLRMDIRATPGMSDEAAIARFYGSTGLYCGYSTALAAAHQACYVSSADFIALQVQAAREYGLRPKRRANQLSGAFAPFGGSFK